ncbi:hypothetical protein BV25DRAFT_1873032 [Artomyces pyxidatus]|uniref:Uncharacterized protein n=1 Tax=Artomyces pyxidatus TaxID=48021 RepID=A0ACB8SIP5_9AGAM|nr:hypothetical protein BV25DRAFT_1873032 [Artomyces pyxidatus]
MKFTNAITSLFFLFAATMFSLVAAAPLARLQSRDVYTPPVLYPHAGTVWKVGARHNVTWDNSDPPVNITNPIGQILLRKGDFTLDGPLASGFNLTAGRVEVTVPHVKPGHDYVIVLFGDSGDWSHKFTITH